MGCKVAMPRSSQDLDVAAKFKSGEHLARLIRLVCPRQGAANIFSATSREGKIAGLPRKSSVSLNGRPLPPSRRNSVSPNGCRQIRFAGDLTDQEGLDSDGT